MSNFIFAKNFQASIRRLINNGILNIAGAGAPTSGASGDGVGICGKGSLYHDVTNAIVYQNTGTAASPTWTALVTPAAASITSAMLATGVLQVDTVTITKANILAMNGAPVTVIAAPAAGSVIELLDAVLVTDFGVAAYTGGGDVTLGYLAGAIQTTTITAANSFGSGTDKVFPFRMLNAAGGLTMPTATAVDIRNATGAFTDPGTAVGVGRLTVAYRVIATGL